MRRAWWRGPMLTLAVALGTMLLLRTALSTFLGVQGPLYGLTLAAVAYVAFAGGLRSGLAAAGVAGGVGFVHYLSLDAILPVLRDRVVVAFTFAAIAFAIAATTGVLSDDALRARTAQQALTQELERKNAQVEAANRELRERNDDLEAFTHVVAHDLKEPVRAMIAYANALDADPESLPSEEAREIVRRSMMTSERLARLLHGLLELSHSAQVPSARAAVVTVRELMDGPECVARLEHVIRERHARVDVEDGPAFLVGTSAAAQIVGNLVLNAIKHNASPAPRVRVVARAGDGAAGKVEIVVEDDGPGFPRAIERAFARENPDRPKTLGGGFGLLIARRAVERLGGQMWVDRSAQLGGAAVHFTLPAAPTVAAAPTVVATG